MLVADDDDLACSTLATIMRRAGHEARTARSAADVYEQASAWEPEAVILDRRLGTDDGLTVARALRERQGDQVRLVLLSGEHHDVVPVDVDAVLLKPVGPRDVIAAVCG